MANWRKYFAVSDRWQLTVRLSAYTALALLLLGVGRRGIVAPAAMPSVSLPPPVQAAQFSADELKIKKQLEAQLQAVRPTHRLTLTDGRVIDCQIVTRTDTALRVRECFGYSGQIIASYPREKLRSLASLPADMFEVTLADVQLYQEFPTFKFSKFPPYTFVSDESFGTIECILQQLVGLRRQFLERFAPLIREPDRPRDIQVVFFGKQEQFKKYAAQTAPSFVNSAGFYSVHQDRLAILNQLGSSHYSHLQEQIIRSQRRPELSPQDNSQAIEATERRLAVARADLNRMAQAITERSISHEGAHQLLYAYGIHSLAAAEPTWLKEGIAEYCETAELGSLHPELARRVAELHRQKKLMPLQTLLNFHSDTGFVSLTEERSVAAYAQSWALVYFLMQEPTRARFFDFIKRYRDIDDETSAAQLRNADVAEGLAAALSTDFSKLESEWLEFVTDL